VDLAARMGWPIRLILLLAIAAWNLLLFFPRG
jgi:hypothetical protein